ncbi:MAG: tRNA (adenosine(37)-N6)-threonylcarbamoyltransferase complex dimerization subunit type 1 TsaB [Candidatus Acidiferrum sp.]
MNLLALDTCDSRGSLAILRDDEILKTIVHEGTADYSSWLLPSADEALHDCGLKMTDIDVLAAAAGPGSFTGVRVGLTAVKAWSEVHRKPIASVSRLQAIASQAAVATSYVAACFDAQREQVFGGLYRREGHDLCVVDQEMVVPPDGFLRWVEETTVGAAVCWVSLDPGKLTSLQPWESHAQKGESVQQSTTVLAPVIGRIGRQRALAGQLIDALKLDAEYVRRSDAEIFWKGGAKRGA